MMRGINLLPQEYRTSGRRRLVAAARLLGAAVVVGAAVAVPALLYRQNRAYEARLAAVAGRAGTADLERVAGMLRRLRQLEESARRKEAAVAAGRGTAALLAALEAVERSAARVTVDRLAVDELGGVEVEGKASGVPEVVALVRSLEEGGLAEVDVSFPEPFRDGVGFRLTARVAGGGHGGDALGGAAQ